MSLILDALNRSRQDAEPVPGLASEHFVEKAPNRWRHLPWAFVLVAVLVIAWLIWDRTGNDSAQEGLVSPVAELSRNIGSAASAVTTQLKSRAATAREPTAPATVAGRPAVSPVSAAPAQQPVATAPPGVTAGESPAPAVAKKDFSAQKSAAVAELYAALAREEVPGAGLEARSAAQRASAAAKPEPSASQREPSASKQEPSASGSKSAARTEESIDIEQLMQQAQVEVENARLEEHPAPFLVALSQQTKNAIPTILYQRHDYFGEDGRSRVVLNGKTLGVGGSPGQGLKVDEILSDSVVLNYRGTQFRLRALNSWVNL